MKWRLKAGVILFSIKIVFSFELLPSRNRSEKHSPLGHLQRPVNGANITHLSEAVVSIV